MTDETALASSRRAEAEERGMNIYARLAKARDQFHALKLKKSGKNTFANYTYFELGDFLIPAIRCLADNSLVPVVSFDADTATMIVYQSDGSDFIKITSPMADANLKGCHPIQNLGAVQTYQRRYLWVTLMEIVEHDALDASEPVKDAPVKEVKSLATPTQKAALNEYLEAGKMPTRRAEWYKKNRDTVTESQAKTIINECKEMEQAA